MAMTLICYEGMEDKKHQASKNSHSLPDMGPQGSVSIPELLVKLCVIN